MVMIPNSMKMLLNFDKGEVIVIDKITHLTHTLLRC